MSCQRLKRCRDCKSCGAPSSRRPPTRGLPHLLIPVMGSNPQHHHQMRMQKHLTYILPTLPGLPQLRRRGRADAGAGVAVAGAGALPRLNLRFSRLLRLALNLKAKRTTTSLAAQRRCDALQLPRRASAQDSPPWTPLPWKKSCASACSRFKASLLVSGERSALPSARPWRSFRTDTRPSRSSKDGSCSSSRRACFCTVPAGSHASRQMSLIAGVRPSIAVNGRNCCNVPPRPFGRATATEPTLTSFKLERPVQLPSFIWGSFQPQAGRSSPRHWRRVLTLRLKH